MKNYGYIYETQNLINGRAYIGQHKGQYNPRYIGSGIILKRAIRKYGQNNFNNKLLAFGYSRKGLNMLEQLFIEEYRLKALNGLYNLTDGGEGGYTGAKGWHHPEETKRMMSLLRKGRVAWNKGLPGIFKGHRHTIEAKIKNSEKHKGRISPWKGKHPLTETLEKMRQANLGKKMSEESRQKISRANLGRKSVKWWTGKKLSEEHKKAISLGHLKMQAARRMS